MADTAGATLPGVTVTVSSASGRQTFVTNENGEFRFLGLDPGTYTVTAELSGFSTIRREVDVLLGRNTEFQFTLSPSVSEAITVTAAAAMTTACARTEAPGPAHAAPTSPSIEPKAKSTTRLEGVVHIASGNYFSCATLGDGTVACWGENREGELGDKEIDFALLVDGLAAEREQGVTIDVAYRFFSPESR